MGHSHTPLCREGGSVCGGMGRRKGGQSALFPHGGAARISQPCGETGPTGRTNPATRVSTSAFIK